MNRTEESFRQSLLFGISQEVLPNHQEGSDLVGDFCDAPVSLLFSNFHALTFGSIFPMVLRLTFSSEFDRVVAQDALQQFS